jgi:hypothetical protein
VFCSTTWFISNIGDAHQAQTSDNPEAAKEVGDIVLMVIDAQPRVHAGKHEYIVMSPVIRRQTSSPFMRL